MMGLLREVRLEWKTIRPAARLAIWTALLAPAAAVLIFSLVVSPEDFSKPSLAWFPRCPYKVATGLDCPTCGATRAFCSFSHGRIAEGLAFNAVAVYTYLGCWPASVAYALIVAGALRRTFRTLLSFSRRTNAWQGRHDASRSRLRRFFSAWYQKVGRVTA